MTPAQKQLIDRLDAIASANCNDVRNMGDEPVPEITWGELDKIGRAAQEAADALRDRP